MLDAEASGLWFDKAWYLARNPDVARVAIDPLAHYQRYGEAEGRCPSPWFDPVWYRQAYDVPAEQSALEHFLTRRGTGAYLPSPDLYLVPFSHPWRDDIAAGIDPFAHYLSIMVTPERELLPDFGLLRHCGLIDPLYFQINAVDKCERELDPTLHYCRFGWRHRMRPSTAFDPDWYAETNPAVTRMRINPLTHYILEGEPANRRPVPWFDPGWYRSRYDPPVEEPALAHYLRHRLTRTVSPNPLFDLDWYLVRHGASIPAEVDPFSHYLLHGAIEDIDPSPLFNARAWRHLRMAPSWAEGQSELPVAARNPLVHFLRSMYAAKATQEPEGGVFRPASW